MEGLRLTRSGLVVPDAESTPAPITDSDIEELIADALFRVEDLRKQGGFTVERVGTWLWAHGNTRPYRRELRQLGWDWSSDKGKWYWAPRDNTRRRRGHAVPYDQITAKYGREEV